VEHTFAASMQCYFVNLVKLTLQALALKSTMNVNGFKINKNSFFNLTFHETKRPSGKFQPEMNGQ
jgi:hypothetical protein